MLLSGEPVTAAEAYRIGLVNAVVPQADLLDYSRAWLGKVLANGPLALGLVMDAVDVGLEAGLEAGLRFEAAAFGDRGGHGRRSRRHAGVSREEAPGLRGKVEHVESI